jgi:hypothetical protein
MAQRSRVCLGCGLALDIRGKRNWSEYCSEACKPQCSVKDCGGAVRKRGWCASHYAQWQKTDIEPRPFRWKWAEPQPCVVCGSDDRTTELRQFCSRACRVLHVKYKGNVPSTVGCVLCGTKIALTVRGKGGQRKKASTKLCKPCRHDYNKYKMTARQLALRDGATCGICGGVVDMDVRRSVNAKWCASVDHITPRSLGGTHEPENLQLAHLYCNQVKSDLRGAVP